MSTELIGKKARVFDFDDTLIGREWVTRISGSAIGRIRPHSLPTFSLDDVFLLDLNHGRVPVSISGLKERISFEFHARRNVYPGVKRELEIMAAERVDIYGNTGRSHKREWVDMTEETLRRGGVREYFKGIFYTPDGTRTAVSKAHGIQILTGQYEEVEFDDDDPRTAYFIAQLFPAVRVNLIQHGSTSLFLARRILDDPSNIRRVGVFGKRVS